MPSVSCRSAQTQTRSWRPDRNSAMGDTAPTTTAQQQQLTTMHPLIDRDHYIPDTLDFRTDAAAQEYWTHCFENLAAKFVEQAAISQQTDPTAVERSAGCLRDFLKQMRILVGVETKTSATTDDNRWVRAKSSCLFVCLSRPRSQEFVWKGFEFLFLNFEIFWTSVNIFYNHKKNPTFSQASNIK